LDKNKIEILMFLETKMHMVAPNICEIIGPKVASKLISAAGGIDELSKIPASNI
jgi:U4/U6 small nuclear ribonucleoprotein PRP31